MRIAICDLRHFHINISKVIKNMNSFRLIEITKLSIIISYHYPYHPKFSEREK